MPKRRKNRKIFEGILESDIKSETQFGISSLFRTLEIPEGTKVKITVDIIEED